MNDNVKATFEHMLGGRPVSDKLEKMYEDVKLMNDRISGGILPEGVLALMAILCADDTEVVDNTIDWSGVKEGSKLQYLDKGEMRKAKFVKAYDSVSHKNKILVHRDMDGPGKNTMIDKATAELME